MTGLFAAVGERVLRRVVPKATAEAGWWSTVCVDCVIGAKAYKWWCWKNGLDVDCECRLYCDNCCGW